MRKTAADANFVDLPMVASMWLNALVSPTRALPEGRASPKQLRALRAAVVALQRLFCQALPWRHDETSETPVMPPLHYPIRTCG
jgi:hypothetical protein